MNEAEFYQILLKAKEFTWQRQGSGQAIRAKLLGRTLRKDDAIVEFFTPVTAVALHHLHKAYHPADDYVAAKALGLSVHLAQKIIHNSDFPPTL